jgi:CheY-like chemotaxis protein
MQKSQNSQKKIVVIDDDPDIIDFLHDFLEMQGYMPSISTKADYLETLQDGLLPDLILLDVFLSGKDGREIVRYLKTQEKTRYIPVIMVSAHPSAEEAARAVGAEDFLAKPFELDELLLKIQRYL